MMRCFYCLIVAAVATSSASAIDPSEWLSLGGEKSTPAKRSKIDTRELLRRYPVGKSWAASKVLRIRGLAVNENWGIEGRTNVVYTNRYSSKTSVTANEYGDVTFQINILEAS